MRGYLYLVRLGSAKLFSSQQIDEILAFYCVVPRLKHLLNCAIEFHQLIRLLQGLQPILVAEKVRIMLSNDFRFRETMNTFRTSVPARDEPAQVKSANGVIAKVLD